MKKASSSENVLTRLINSIFWFFDRVYSSNYNPLYNSGTLALGLLIIVLITGLYLLVFYKVSDPHSSIVAIQSQVWTGRWIRSLHRYASDAAVIAVLFHVIRLIIQRRSWGPRTLAWMSGVILTLALFFSAYTGFVMVWDSFGKTLAIEGARMADRLPFFSEPIERSFLGDKPVPASFFFMNLFLHVALPLGMIFILWIHTIRLARSSWLPVKKIFIWSGVALTVLSIVWPVSLLPKANLLAFNLHIPIDWFYGFWLPLGLKVAPSSNLILWLGVISIGLSAPLWLKPKKAARPAPAINYTFACGGCQSCYKACPFEAIEMVPRTEGEGSKLVSQVSSDLCVGCGICTAACNDLAVGPPGLLAADQTYAYNQLVQQGVIKSDTIVLMHCGQNALFSRSAALDALKQYDHVYPMSAGCIGSVHSDLIELAVKTSRGVMLVGCPPRDCAYREGTEFLEQRIYHNQKHALAKSVDRSKIRLAHCSGGELNKLTQELDDFNDALNGKPRRGPELKLGARWRRYTVRFAFTIVLLFAIGALNRISLASPPTEGMVRLGWRLPGQKVVACRELSESEISKLPRHMQTPKSCSEQYLNYRLQAFVDRETVLDEIVKPGGLRSDRPLFVQRDIALKPGNYALRILFEPLAPDSKEFSGDLDLQDARRLELISQVEIQAGQIALYAYDEDKEGLVLTQAAKPS